MPSALRAVATLRQMAAGKIFIVKLPCFIRKICLHKQIFYLCENGIDHIAIERLDKRTTMAEVKRNIRKYSPEALEKKYALIEKNFRGYSVELRGLSLEDM